MSTKAPHKEYASNEQVRTIASCELIEAITRALICA